MERDVVVRSIGRVVQKVKRRLVRVLETAAPQRALIGEHFEPLGPYHQDMVRLPQAFPDAAHEPERHGLGAATIDAGGTGDTEQSFVTFVERQIDLLRGEIARLQSELIAAHDRQSRFLAILEGGQVPIAGGTAPPSPECANGSRNRRRFQEWLARNMEAADSGNGGPPARALISQPALNVSQGSVARQPAAGEESAVRSIAGAHEAVAPTEPGAVPVSPAGATSCPDDPTEEKLWLERGVELTEQGRHARALRAYDRALCLKPDYVEAWLNKGVALSGQKRYDKALRAYEEALRLAPNHPEIWHYKALALAKQERYSDAQTALEQALGLNPLLADVWSDKGFVLIRLGFYSDAIRACNEALRLSPEHRVARNNRARALNLQTKLRQHRPVRSEHQHSRTRRRRRRGTGTPT